MRGFQAGELAGNRQGTKLRWSVAKSFPFCSFNGYDNFISSNHVKAAARRRFDGPRVRAQILNLQSQGVVCTAQSFYICLHANVLL
jgi:hypothetical protein